WQTAWPLLSDNIHYDTLALWGPGLRQAPPAPPWTQRAASIPPQDSLGVLALLQLGILAGPPIDLELIHELLCRFLNFLRRVLLIGRSVLGGVCAAIRVFRVSLLNVRMRFAGQRLRELVVAQVGLLN